jgi:putative phage-type endonuclease
MNVEKKLTVVDHEGRPIEPEMAQIQAAGTARMDELVAEYQRKTWEEINARVTAYASREHWLAARQAGIGGSEVAIIMGASKWGSPYSLWARKSGLDPGEDQDNDILEFGRLVEPLVAAKYAEKTGRQVIDLGSWAIRRHPTLDFLFVSHDRMLAPVPEHDGPGVLSIKSVNPYVDEGEWFDGEAPLKYEIQLQAELAASGCSWGSFGFLQWGKGVRWFDRARNDAFLAAMEAECRDFWRLVETGEAPPIDGSERTSEAIKRMWPEPDPNTIVTLPPEAGDWTVELEGIESQLKQLEGRKEELRNRLKAAIADGEIGVVPDGPRWTYKAVKVDGYTVETKTQRRLQRKVEKQKKGQV